MAATDIKYFTFENLNAPQLQNAYGSMIEVLDACLVTGITLPQVAGITFADGIATISFNTAHKIKQYQVIEITGANVTELNTQHRLLSVTSTTATFKTSVTSAGGTFIARLPALGWEKAFGSSNVNGGGKAAYRSKNLLLPSRPFLRVVDELDPAYTATYAKYAKVGIVEDMTDIDTMLGVQAPFDSTLPDKNWVGTGSGTSAYNGWCKWFYARSVGAISQAADSTTTTNGVRMWVLVGNGDWFYILPATTNNSTPKLTYGFGAFESFLDADNSCTFLGGNLEYQFASSASTSWTSFKGSGCALSGNYAGIGNQSILFQRNYSQKPSYSAGLGVSLLTNVKSGAVDRFSSIGLTNRAVFAPVFLEDTVLRGKLPSIFWLFHALPYADMQTFTDEGKAFIAVTVAPYYNETGSVVFELGGFF
ncbi:hypothetical protein N5B99_08800 [Acinetobacter johnsonii]|uniref:hypothetical protein n=1 Tax=Acinetobacter johnsonii TaxID=40214 RepID=UPI00244CE631|nr:hypothetical protein [Acinetobacter johnsonii]MDH1240760.1 hypothetical protein [Acinetobacter johnsonii]